MPMKDEIIAFLATYGIENDNGIYRLMPACDNFFFLHPNTDSDCCEDDVMLSRSQMNNRFWTILNVFGIFNRDDWNPVCSDYTPLIFVGEDGQGGDHKCICTHNIFNFFFLKHIPTNIVLLVGCECVDKIDERIRYKHKNCKICQKDFPKTVNRATKPYSSGCCSDECKRINDDKKKEAKRLEKEKKKLEKKEAKELEDEKLEKEMLDEYDRKNAIEMAEARERRRLEYEKNKQSNPIQHKKLLLKGTILEKKTMNIQSNDQLLSQDDAKKLLGYERIDFGNLNEGDHFRYTSNKYQEEGRKLAYGVVKTKGLGSITVNSYQPNPMEPPTFPDWTIKHPDHNKQYLFYKKIK